jgi:hypothetical protein
MGQQGRVFLIVCALAIIVGLSLVVAWVTFGLLDSSATAEIRGYKLGGSIAAFAFTAGVLTTAFFSMYKLFTADEVKELSQRKDAEFKHYAQHTSEQLKEYAKRVEELQAKLIRGAPCPPGYTIDVDEKHKLVFSRPSAWKPLDGVLYQYIGQPKKDETFRANFNVVYKDLSELPVEEFDPSQPEVLDHFYEQVLETVAQGLSGGITKEYVTVDGLKSVKYINTQAVPTSDPVQTQEHVQTPEATLRRCGVITYVPRAKAAYIFTFTDDEKHFLASSEVFNNVTESIRFL